MKKEFIILTDTFYNQFRGTYGDAVVIGVADSVTGMKRLQTNVIANASHDRKFEFRVVETSDEYIESLKENGNLQWDFRETRD